MAKRPCAQPGCAALVDRGYCEAHAKRSPAALSEERRGSAAKRGYGRLWQRARESYLRQHPLCADPDGVHGERSVLAEVVDHRAPHKGDYGLFWDQGNWQPLCKACHDRKTAKEDGGFGPRG